MFFFRNTSWVHAKAIYGCYKLRPPRTQGHSIQPRIWSIVGRSPSFVPPRRHPSPRTPQSTADELISKRERSNGNTALSRTAGVSARRASVRPYIQAITHIHSERLEGRRLDVEICIALTDSFMRWRPTTRSMLFCGHQRRYLRLHGVNE